MDGDRDCDKSKDCISGHGLSNRYVRIAKSIRFCAFISLRIPFLCQFSMESRNCVAAFLREKKKGITTEIWRLIR